MRRAADKDVFNQKSPVSLMIQGFSYGTPDAIRTHDLQSRSLTLYPAELRARTDDIVPVKRLFVKGLGLFLPDGFAGGTRLFQIVFAVFRSKVPPHVYF